MCVSLVTGLLFIIIIIIIIIITDPRNPVKSVDETLTITNS
jgi:hypothetical protein